MITIQEDSKVSNTDIKTSSKSPKTTVYCSSTDTKPTNIPNGSECIETDTGKKFLYDADSSVWNEISSGGGSTPSSVIVVDLVYHSGDTWTVSDVNFADLVAAYKAGSQIYVRESRSHSGAFMTLDETYPESPKLNAVIAGLAVGGGGDTLYPVYIEVQFSDASYDDEPIGMYISCYLAFDGSNADEVTYEFPE